MDKSFSELKWPPMALYMDLITYEYMLIVATK